jgi:hypothetical protein
VSCSGNTTTLLNARDIREMMKPSRAGGMPHPLIVFASCYRADCFTGTSEKFVMQKVVSSRGVRSHLLRCQWRRDKPSLMWSCSNFVSKSFLLTLLAPNYVKIDVSPCGLPTRLAEMIQAQNWRPNCWYTRQLLVLVPCMLCMVTQRRKLLS